MADGTLAYRVLRRLRRRTFAAAGRGRTYASALATMIERELTTGRAVDIPLRRRLWLWRRGFTSRSSALFDIDEGNYRQFVSDLQHELADDAAGSWDAVVNNKLTFYLLFAGFDEHLPALYGVLDGGRFRRESPLLVTPPWEADSAADGDRRTVGASDWVTTALDATGALVLKPIHGQGGRGVLVCRRAGDGSDDYLVNGERRSPAGFAASIDDLDEYLAWEFVEQLPYADELFAESANTLRVITLWDDETDEPFVAGAVHRIGTADSAPVDNWSRGGLSAEVHDDGTLSRGAQWLPSEGEVRWFDTHPDTGARIEGARVPDWPAVRERLVEVASEFPYLPRLGWDVVVTDDGGFVVLEVNAHAATRTIQVHRPLLTDPRVRRFYERHGHEWGRP